MAVAFDTNISGNEISDFVKYQLTKMPKWKIESYAIASDGDNQFCYTSQSYASVVKQNEIMNKVAKKKIQAVLNGKSSSTVKDTSGYSQEASENNAIGNTDELEAMGIINQKKNKESTKEDKVDPEESYVQPDYSSGNDQNDSDSYYQDDYSYQDPGYEDYGY